MAARRPPADRFALGPETELRATVACRELNMRKADWLEEAAQFQLGRSRHALKVNRFEAARQEAKAKRQPCPLPQDFGLPSDFK